MNPLILRTSAFAWLICLSAAGCSGGGKSPAPPPDTDRDSVVDSQDCAPADATKWQLLSFESLDGDSEGHRINSSGQLCSGAALAPTHFVSAVAASDADCDDANSDRWQLSPYAAIDADGDGSQIASVGQVCSGESLPAGYGATAPALATSDCDDADRAVWRLMTTYRDSDGDGVGGGTGEVTCVGAHVSAGSSLLGYDPVDDTADPTSASVSNVDLPPWLLATP